jgi:UDP-N-acetylmuramoyl-tripeptide--D-alanyl-D-alanine ligase
MTGPATALWTASEAVRATGGHCGCDWQATGVSIDSRTVRPGDLFVALAGPRFDGHDFVAAALDRGAAAAMVARRPPRLSFDAPLLLVEDTFKGLRDLGRAGRARSRARVIGVTGSVGKTGVKEALRLVLAEQGRTAASEGSLNNHWGLPLSLARLPNDAVFAVFELGMNHPGEIAPLSLLARPHVAAVTTVEAVHKEYFASVEAIADAKAEIFAGVEAGGSAVLNRDNRQFTRLAAAAGAARISQVITFGRHHDAGVRVVTAETGPAGSRVRARVGGEVLDYELAVPGDHWVSNSLCVLAAAVAVGADARRAATSLGRFTLPKGRGQRFAVPLAAGAFTVIDDSYNASPVSMAAALAVLGQLPPGPGGRRIAVLGDMLELGEEGAERHADLMAPLKASAIDLVFAAGPLMRHLFDRLPLAMQGGYAETSALLAAKVAASVRPGDVVTVKGSAASRMGIVVDAMKALASSDPGQLANARMANGG